MMTVKRQLSVFIENEGIWVHWFGHPLRYSATTEETEGKYGLSVGSVDLISFNWPSENACWTRSLCPQNLRLTCMRPLID